MKNDILSIMTTMEFYNRGIVPLESVHHDVNKILSSLSPEEARKMKRKFRKIWRNLRKKSMKTKISQRTIDKTYGAPGTDPTRTQKNNRKGSVVSHIKNCASKIVKKMAEAKN